MKSLMRSFLVLTTFFFIVFNIDLSQPNSNSVSQFKFQQQFELPQKFNTLDNFGILDNNTIAINGFLGQSSITQIKVFSGNNYQTKISQINITRQATVKYFNSKIYINQNSQIQSIDKSTTINKYQYSSPYNSQFYSQSITTNKFIIFHLQNKCPALAVIDRVTMNMSTIYPDGQVDCDCQLCDSWQGVLKDLKNGKIVYGIRYNLYILNANTLQVQQKIIQRKKFEDTDFTYFESFYDKTTQQSIILIKGSSLRYETFSYNKATKKYEESSRIQGISQNMKLIGINQGYSFQSNNRKNKLLHWNKIQNLILYQDTAYSDQCLQSKVFIDMPKSQSFFVMRSDFTFYIYELNDTSPSYDVKLKKSVSLKYSIERGQLTSDQKFLILFAKKFHLSFYEISSEAIIQLKNKAYEDFLVFNSKYDRFIVFKSVNQTIGNTTKTIYSIEIRKITDPQTSIKEVPLILPQSTQIFGVKLIHNDVWGLDFLVLFKLEDDDLGKRKYKDKTLQQFCTLQNDQIIQKQLENDSMSFFNTFASQKWIATSLFSDQYLHVLDRNTLQQVGSFDIDFYFYNDNKAYPFFYEDTLIIRDLNKNQLLFLELNKNTFDEMEISILSIYMSGNQQLTQRMIYFPQKSILYTHAFYPNSNYESCKAIYNTPFPIDKVIIYDNQSQILKQLYISKNKNNNLKQIQKNNLGQAKVNDCDMVISKDRFDKLIVWKNCQPFNETKQYKTEQLSGSTGLQLYECSDNKHIVLAYPSVKGFTIQVRSLEDDLKIVWKTYPDAYYFRIPMVDLTRDGILLYNGIGTVTATNFSSIESLGDYKLRIIYDFVYNKRGDSAITGYVKTIYQDLFFQDIIGFIVLSNINNKKTTIFQHEVTIFNYSYQLSQSKIRLNQNSTKILLSYIEKKRQIKIQVWDIQGNQLVFQLQRSGLGMELIEFLNQTHFIIKIDNNTEIIFYQPNQSISSSNQIISSSNQSLPSSKQNVSYSVKFALSLPDFQKIAVSNDGSILALLTDYIKGTIIIFDSNQTEIGKIQLKNASIISGLLFDNFNQLFVIDTSSKIFTFSKSTCGQTFINVNSYCQCRANLTLVDSVCQCQQNFQKYDDNSCICTGSDKYFYQNQCIICSFMCSECNGPGLSCTVFSVWFYVIFIGGPLILVCTVIAVIFIKNKNKKKLGDDFDECKDKVEKNGQKKVKISEATSKDLLIDESLESQLRN